MRERKEAEERERVQRELRQREWESRHRVQRSSSSHHQPAAAAAAGPACARPQLTASLLSRNEASVRWWLQLRIDIDSTGVRRLFD